ncbi:unnamed protein product [Leptosia nina]|uniref:Transmembrane 9 superfamily member n=1 Tax=Leptosia nina TaxID=320188 RepID=A0AAV1J3Z8_9NEOP
MVITPHVLCVLLVLMPIKGHYLSGLAPVNYCKAGAESEKCKLPVENLGHVGFGEQIQPSPYKINFLENVSCQTVCTKSYKGSDTESKKKLNLLKNGMTLFYQHHWIIDNMPTVWCYLVNEGSKSYCSTGFPMGCQIRMNFDTCTPIVNTSPSQVGTYFLFNHVDINIIYHSGGSEEWGVAFGDNGGRIISVKVKPASINHQNPQKPDCSVRKLLKIPNYLATDETFNIVYTYNFGLKCGKKSFSPPPPPRPDPFWLSSGRRGLFLEVGGLSTPSSIFTDNTLHK